MYKKFLITVQHRYHGEIITDHYKPRRISSRAAPRNRTRPETRPPSSPKLCRRRRFITYCWQTTVVVALSDPLGSLGTVAGLVPHHPHARVQCGRGSTPPHNPASLLRPRVFRVFSPPFPLLVPISLFTYAHIACSRDRLQKRART